MLDAATVIQIALTPVFLLAAMGGLLNVFTTRLARVSDRVNAITESISGGQGLEPWRVHQLYSLRRRTLALEVAVMFAGLSGMLTCLATLGLLVGAIRDEFKAQLLLWLFGAAVVSLMFAFASFLLEMATAGISMLRQLAVDRAILRSRRADGLLASASPPPGNRP